MPLSVFARIGISWTVIVAGGIYAFYLSKTSIVAQRAHHMKVRERMYSSNRGDYEASEHFKHGTVGATEVANDSRA
ncbi:hypothetical protein FQA39_LY07929 [Lamprigera yunnana]|nr:hypothetical protein FQA39_LY07929 [Lamprigera yunnana]